MSNGLLIATELSNFCKNTHQILELVGWALTVFKIAIPIIIIALGLIDLGKAAVSSKPEEIKKSVTSLLYRLIGGVAIFFIPSIIMGIISMALGNSWKQIGEQQVDFDVCYKCVTAPWDGKCKNASSVYDN